MLDVDADWYEEGKYRVLRGGAWYNSNVSLRAANRYRYEPEYGSLNFGFRLARDRFS